MRIKWSVLRQLLKDSNIIVPDSLLQLVKFLKNNPAVLSESQKVPLDDYKRELDRLLKKDPDNSILLSERGRICELEQDFATALDFYQSSLKCGSDNMRTRFKEAFCLRRLGKSEEALEKYQEFVDVYSKKDIVEEQDWTFVDKLPGSYQKAISKEKLLGSMQQRQDYYVDSAIYEIAYIHHDNMRYAEAIAAFKRIESTSSFYPNALYGIASSFYAEKKYVEAIEVLKQALERAPDTWESWLFLGQIHEECEDPDNALGCYRKAMGINPDAKTAIRNAAFILESRGDYAEAVDLINQNLSRFANRPNDYQRLSLLLVDCNIDMKNYTEGLAVLDRMEPEARQNTDYWIYRGICLWPLNQLDEGLSCFRKALEIEPADKCALRNLADGLMCKEDYTEAAEAYKRLLENGENGPEVRGGLAIALAESGHTAEGLETFLALKESNEVFPAQGYYEGHILALAGQTEKAIDALEKYLKQDDDEGAMEELIDLCRRSDLPSRAEAWEQRLAKKREQSEGSSGVDPA